ncbi:hypothetical protein D3C84_1089690 [compost metagenome]
MACSGHINIWSRVWALTSRISRSARRGLRWQAIAVFPPALRLSDSERSRDIRSAYQLSRSPTVDHAPDAALASGLVTIR